MFERHNLSVVTAYLMLMHIDLAHVKCVETIFHEISERACEKQFLLNADKTSDSDPCIMRTFRWLGL